MNIMNIYELFHPLPMRELSVVFSIGGGQTFINVHDVHKPVLGGS